MSWFLFHFVTYILCLRVRIHDSRTINALIWEFHLIFPFSFYLDICGRIFLWTPKPVKTGELCLLGVWDILGRIKGLEIWVPPEQKIAWLENLVGIIGLSKCQVVSSASHTLSALLTWSRGPLLPRLNPRSTTPRKHCHVLTSLPWKLEVVKWLACLAMNLRAMVWLVQAVDIQLIHPFLLLYGLVSKWYLEKPGEGLLW